MTLPLRITPDGGPWPLYRSAATRAAERAALAAAPPQALMARAGLAVARLALAIAPHARRVCVWAGPGNNGGDGLVAARHLHRAGREVIVQVPAPPAAWPADAAWALAEAQAAGVTIVEGNTGPAAADLHIDALLGIGASRAPHGAIAAAVRAMNASGRDVLAVDLPSGLDADTGALLGDDAVRASHTLALLALKPGCHTHSGRDHAGQVWLDSLGVDAGPPDGWLSGAPADTARLHASHKGSFGDVAVVGGAAGMVGAAWLCARSALAAGAGRVYASLLDAAANPFDGARPELMSREAWWLSPPAVLASATVACGCGGGDAMRDALPPLLAHAGRLVLDADALNAVAADESLRSLLQRRRGATLLTPHPLEAARLLGTSAADVQADRIAAATALATRFRCAVLLKGSGTVIAAPGLVPHVNPTGNAALATAGTGDVLAGWIAGCWSQRPGASAAEIAIAAAWQHGDAADRWRAEGRAGPLLANDLIARMTA